MRASSSLRAVRLAFRPRGGFPLPRALSTVTRRPYESKQSEYLGLHNIADNKGARRKRIRVGRGPGSGKGKMAGRGHKGQKSRSGSGGLALFEGGQTPLHKRLPKKGFNNINRIRYTPVNCGDIVARIHEGRIDPAQPITTKTLFDAGLCNGLRDGGVKLLAGGLEGLTTLDCPLTIEVSHVSKEAKVAVEEIGGSVSLRYFNKRALRAHLKPHKFHPALMPGPSIPPPRLHDRYLPYMEEELLEYYDHLYKGPEAPDQPAAPPAQEGGGGGNVQKA